MSYTCKIINLTLRYRKVQTLKTYLYLSVAVASIALSLFTSSCKKDLLLSNDALEFSVDTVLFDTVFTSIGSTTKNFKIYNRSNRPVVIDEVRLAGGSASTYRFNLDGDSGVLFTDVRIPANDSLFGFVEVTLGENNLNDPLIIEDSILFSTNGVEQRVLLAAWGQDAYFHYNDVNEGTWPNDKPHVIYGYAAVDSAQSLTIQAGTNIYLHKNSLLYVYKGSLHIAGELNNKVTIQGDRLEAFYDDVKGQYYGIYFQEARPSLIEHAIIKNGTAGVHVFSEDPSNTGYTVEIRNSEIFNHSSYGIFNYSGGKIRGDNLLVHNNNFYGFFLLEGGDYNFSHCHFLGYGTDGNQPAVAIKNYFTRSDGITYIGGINEGTINNSVLYGNGENQLVYDTITQGGAVPIVYDYQYNLIQLETPIVGNPGFSNNIWNLNPLFNNLEELDYKFPTNSPLNNAGGALFNNFFDIEENPRDPTFPDIGAFEIN